MPKGKLKCKRQAMTACGKMTRINRVTKGQVVYHGLRALTVVGDGDGRIGMEMQIEESVVFQRQKPAENLIKLPLKTHAASHRVAATAVESDDAATKGTGVIAGGAMRAIFEVMGVTDVVAKSTGSSNPYNLVRATLDGLSKISTAADIAAKRGKSVEDILA